MGKFDAESKAYMNINAIFADAFNFLIYDGEQVIKPGDLKPVDTTEIAAPYGNGAKVPIQRYRDILKLWAAMCDEKAIYVLFGGEIQNKVHYAMPVKNMLYDGINYSSQVAEAKRSYRKKEGKDDADGEVSIEDGAIRIKLTSEEFLSGFRKGDRLMPIVTAVIYFGDEEWDGPISLYEMMEFPDERLKKVVPNYFINLIAPKNINDKDFKCKFKTGLGFVLDLVKHQKDNDTKEVVNRHSHVDATSAEFANEIAGLKLVFEKPDEKGEVDMILAMEMNNKKERILASIITLQDTGSSIEQIIDYVTQKYNVTREFVEDIMNAAVAS